ncbi:helix-turn-helix domain-containing protein [Streptomyces candidus]|uniref:Transcriptional regulator with XRE-family HTH domain n=1 Tax=Streptomyces candidus TaxID=67283 RepID=A0A7X0HCQ0_9ACTN|nr:helix-turn-helix transcriptional regulator [Streptomyces candidus]MBB6435198.1 transcriptional regulator with XRE-family HTH domain [Streptomyces candidus]GHH40491.1 transcriptional regulator [Streptomyces candidus]
MSPRGTPTERQRRVGSELRKMRIDAGMTVEFAAGLLGVPRTNVPNMESGRVGVSAVRVRTLAANYGCSDQDYVEALVRMATTRGKGWWESYRGQLPAAILDIDEMEWHARRLRIALSVHMPGLLDTEEHARAVFEQVIPPIPRREIDIRVAHRLARQRALDKPDPPAVDLVIHEAALRMEFGGPKVARRQLEHVLKVSERDNVTVQVVPFKAGGFPGAGQSVIYAEGEVPQLDVVELDSTHGPEFLNSDMQLRKYRALLDRMHEVALSPRESHAFVRTIADQL